MITNWGWETQDENRAEFGGLVGVNICAVKKSPRQMNWQIFLENAEIDFVIWHLTIKCPVQQIKTFSKEIHSSYVEYRRDHLNMVGILISPVWHDVCYG